MSTTPIHTLFWNITAVPRSQKDQNGCTFVHSAMGKGSRELGFGSHFLVLSTLTAANKPTVVGCLPICPFAWFAPVGISLLTASDPNR